MYDQLRTTRIMPDGFQSEDWYQSKSLECSLIDYEIDEDGRLWAIGLGELPDPSGKKRSSYTGEIVFYTFIEDREPPHRWKQYRAVLENGNLTHLEVSDTRYLRGEGSSNGLG